MSFPRQIIYCSKCDYEGSYGYDGILYYYELDNGGKIFAPIGAGYCQNCNEIEKIQYGLSVSKLYQEIDELSVRLKETIKKKFLFIRSKNDKREIEKIQYDIKEKKDYLSLLNGIDSYNVCLICGSTDILPLIFSEKDILLPDGLTLEHINCGGELKWKYSDIRFSFVNEDIIIKPVLKRVEKSENIKPSNTPLEFALSAKNDAKVGECFKAYFAVNRPAKNFVGPKFENFKVVSGPFPQTFQKFDNGVTISILITFTYYLQAIREGSFIIEPAKVDVDGKIYQSNSFTVKVSSI